MEKKVYLYAFNALMRVVGYQYLKGEAISIRNIAATAHWMRMTNPEKVVVYAVDDRPGLCKDYREASHTVDYTKHVEFLDMISREGILVE